MERPGRGMGDRLALRGGALRLAERRGKPRGVARELRLGPVAGGDQQAAAARHEVAERGDDLGRQPIDVRQHDHALTLEGCGREAPRVDDRGLDRRRVVAARGQGDPEEVDLAAERLAARLAVDEQGGDRRGDLDGPARLVVGRHRVVGRGEPDGQEVAARLVERHAERRRGPPARRDRADHLARPRRGLAVDEELDRPGQRPGAGVGDRGRDRHRQPRHERRARHVEPDDRAVGAVVGRAVVAAEVEGPEPGRDRADGREDRGAGPSGTPRRDARRRAGRR